MDTMTMHARMNHPAFTAPGAIDALHALGKSIQRSGLPAKTAELVALRASQINGCGVCAVQHPKILRKLGETDDRIFAEAAWRDAPYFTEAERAALALTEEGTRLADAHHGVSDDTWAEVRKHYDNDQIGALVCLVAMINAATRMNVIVHNPGGSYEPGMFAALDRD